MVNKITNAKIINIEDQDIVSKRTLVKGGPITCPAEPAAVVIPRAKDLFSGDVARPTTAKIGPKPVPAIPNPIIIFKNWWPSGDEDWLLINNPVVYKMIPIKIAFLSPYFSAKAPKKGVAIPQAKFCIAIASENSDLAQRNSCAIGIWNNPKVERIAKPVNRIKLPPISMGEKILFLLGVVIES